MLKLQKGKLNQPWKILSLGLILSSTVTGVIAEEANFYRFPTGEQEGGGVRGLEVSCNADITYPIPLVPQTYQTITASATPKLFFDASNITSADVFDFLLLDQNDQIVYQDLLTVDRQSTIISLELAPKNSSQELQLNNSYHWYLVKNCGDNSPPLIFASGSLQRIELQKQLAQKLADASEIDKINLYQGANLWHEAIENMTRLECHHDDVYFISNITDAVNNSNSLTNSLNVDLCLATK